MTTAIIDSEGNEVKSAKQTFAKPADRCVLSFGLPIDYLDSGNYKIVITVEDVNHCGKATQSANFVVVKPFDTHSAAAFDVTLRQLKYLASEADLMRLGRLPQPQRESALQEFLKQFDATPETEQNEFVLEYYRRIYYANQNFHSENGERWETPQGEIYVKNGAPNSIERQLNSDDKSYEVWEYYTINRRHVFVDEWARPISAAENHR